MKRAFFILLMMVTGVTLADAQSCSRCGGSGRISEQCQVCHGNGSRSCNYCNNGYKMCTVCMREGSCTCGTCNGSGTYDDDTCPTCSGRGRVICERCSGDGVIMCDSCQGVGSGNCFNCGGLGYKEWRCPECIAAGRI